MSRRNLFILLICCVSLFMNYLDGTILNVALPALSRDLHAGAAALQWIVDSFLLTLTCLLILAGSLADRLGRRPFLIAGLVVFAGGSLGCSLATGVSELIAWRVVAAIGGSMLVPTTLSIVRNTFHGRELARAIGIWSGVYGLASACGPLVGGALVDSTGWRSIFLVNVPVGLAGALLAVRFIPNSVAEHPRRIDVGGELLLIAFLGTLVYTVIEAPNLGWGSKLTIGGFVVSALLLAWFCWTEARAVEPLLDIRFFRVPAFAGANLLAVFTFVLMNGFLFVNTIYLQEVRGLSPLGAGLFTLPLMAAITIVAPLSGRMLGHRGPRLSMTASAGLALLAFAMLGVGGAHAPTALLASAYALLGVGFGLVNPAITHTTVSSMPAGQAGVASAITSASRQIGSSIGVALFGSIAVTVLESSLRAQIASLGLSSNLRGAVVSAGLKALQSNFGPRTSAIHQLARTTYSGALEVIWWLSMATALAWLVVGWRATRSAAIADRPAVRAEMPLP